MSAAAVVDTSPTIPCPPPSAPLPTSVQRQLLGAEPWRRRLIFRVWYQRDHALEIFETGGIPFLPCDRAKISKRRIASLLDQPGQVSDVLHGVLCAFFDDAVAAKNTLPVVCFDDRARHGFVIVRLPLSRAALAGAA